MPILGTERLVLRDFALRDWDTLNDFMSDPAVTRFMHFASWDEEKRRSWFASLRFEQQTTSSVSGKLMVM
jgi:RimJ/RimL family protein N-acetyltransferase